MAFFSFQVNVQCVGPFTTECLRDGLLDQEEKNVVEELLAAWFAFAS